MEKESTPLDVIHCRYEDLKHDPEAFLRKLYAKLGRPFTPQFQERMNKKLKEMKDTLRTKAYSHSLQDTGVSADEFLQVNGKYLEACKGLSFL